MMDPMDEFDQMRVGLALSAVTISDLILDAAVSKIDALFGKGYAKAHPDLVGTYLETTALSFQNDMEAAAYAGSDGDLELDDMFGDFDEMADDEKEH